MVFDHSGVEEDPRGLALFAAQAQASAMFGEIERRLIRAGVTESQLDREIYALAAEMFGVTTHWHKRVIRAGLNTLQPYN
jgi:Xaa-Pro dipeptidase